MRPQTLAYTNWEKLGFVYCLKIIQLKVQKHALVKRREIRGEFSFGVSISDKSNKPRRATCSWSILCSLGLLFWECPSSLLKTETPASNVSRFVQKGYYTNSLFSRISSYHFTLHKFLKFSPWLGISSANVTLGREDWEMQEIWVINSHSINNDVGGIFRKKAIDSRNVFVS